MPDAGALRVLLPKWQMARRRMIAILHDHRRLKLVPRMQIEIAADHLAIFGPLVQSVNRAMRADKSLAVLFHERTQGMVEQVEHGFRRPAQLDALRRHDHRPVDQDRMRQHEIDQLVVAPFWIGKPQLCIGRALFAQQRAHRNPHRLDQFDQPRTAWRILQIFYDMRLFAALPDHGQRVARGAACRVMVDRHAHS